ncbi:DUF2630 family protein [Murinocardiopsis flavida]|nr:DUF2630 family protein [Murinocardiopsis flavida]
MADTNSQESSILRQISALVTEERDLRERSEHRLTPEERKRIRALDVELDQCWDLLRQRRARDEFDQDPGTAAVRPASEVEGYRQ